jgi:hypothetical protein
VTERLTPAEAIRKYGPITELELGPQGGFKTVTYGTTKFMSRFVDPRGTGMYDESVVIVPDPTRDTYECPVCGAAPGEQCVNKDQQPRSTHNKRHEGRRRWEIERAAAEAQKAHEEAEAAEQRRRKLAIPPAIGAVLAPERNYWQGELPEQFTVEQTYANRTVRAVADNGEQVFLERGYSGDWFVICGQPTSGRTPCRNSLDPRCRVKHKAGLQLRDDEPWC